MEEASTSRLPVAGENEVTTKTSTLETKGGNADSIPEQREKTNIDPFLQSMTFASRRQHAALECDCDECGVAPSGQSFVPNAIQQALNEYHRQKRRTFKRTQQRTLLKKQSVSIDNGSSSAMISVWEWTLPLHGEPLLEFGNSHRLVFVKRLSGVLKQIGTGIVGSSSEEKGRQTLDWKSGEVYLVPSRQGKAVGWILEQASSKRQKSEEMTPTEKEESGPTVLYILKVPTDLLPCKEEIMSSTDWFQVARRVCQRTVDAVTLDNDQKSAALFHVVNPSDAQLIANICRKE